MDEPGYRARRRAEKEISEQTHYRGPDGKFQPREQIMPMDERFIGGFNAPGAPPVVPPKDGVAMPEHMGRYYQPGDAHQAEIDRKLVDPAHLARMSAVERAHNLKVPVMEPHLQFMVGPLLRYDTVDERGVWHGAALIVTSDAGSVYEPHPVLRYYFDPDQPASSRVKSPKTRAYELGRHPADPYSSAAPMDGELDNNSAPGPNFQSYQVPGHEIWVYAGNGGTFTFWRFLITIPLGPNEMRIKYNVNHGQDLEFSVPAIDQNMRMAAYSCNGFSAGVNPDAFRGPGFQSGYDPVWVDLLSKHAEQPFHALVGGGDQLYCDVLTREPEMQDWVNTKQADAKKHFPLSVELELAIDRFYFNHYCSCFRSGAFARANCSIPMVNMADDHDLIDGFGSYPDDLQLSPVFRRIGSRGYFFFLLFQCFVNPEVDGVDDTNHVNKSIIIGGDGPYVPFPSHSFLTYMGPNIYMLLLDCRAERKKDQVCSPKEYEKVFARLYALPPNVEHLIVQLGIPIAYPRMVFMETILESKFNPLTHLGRAGSLGLAGFVNKFNADAELLDDLNDHWTAKSHKKERNWLVEQLQQIAKTKHVRISFLSGDVHCAAVGVFKTLVKGKNKEDVPAATDHRFMLNIVTSAIVNTPPPAGVLTMVGTLATKTHRTMHYCDTDEAMVPLFQHDTNGTNLKNKYIMGRRNWCSIHMDQASGELIFDVLIEKEKGFGTTVPYTVHAPPPKWTS